MGSRILGVGTDIEEVSRFRRLGEQFFERNFTRKEIDYCRSRADPYRHFAGRFACKEAITKALSPSGFRASFPEIEIVNNRHGAPMASISSMQGNSLMISISHTREIATATAILTDANR